MREGVEGLETEACFQGSGLSRLSIEQAYHTYKSSLNYVTLHHYVINNHFSQRLYKYKTKRVRYLYYFVLKYPKF